VLRESRDCGELIHAVEAGDIDVTFLDIGPSDTGPLEVRPVLDDPMVFLAPANSPQAGQNAISIADVVHLPMIGTRDPGCREIIDEAFRQAPTSPSYVFRSDDHPTIHGLIGSGLGYAVLPLLAVDENDPKVAIIPIKPVPPPRRLGIAWHPERRPPPALLPFVEAAADVCRDLGERWAELHAA
jgi:DNA-binding transcriptional LysR family regulator